MQLKQQQNCVHKNLLNETNRIGRSLILLPTFPKIFSTSFCTDIKNIFYINFVLHFVKYVNVCRSKKKPFIFDRFDIDIVSCISKICCAVHFCPFTLCLFAVAHFEFVSLYVLLKE